MSENEPHYRTGWYQVAFARDLVRELTPLNFGRRRLFALNRAHGVRIFDATCPHRGAHLALGGKVVDDAVICPFHGHRIRLGAQNGDPLCVREYPSFVRGGMVFMSLSEKNEVDLVRALDQLAADHVFVPGFTMQAATTIEIVMENGFDNAHFKSVHGLLSDPVFTVRMGSFGELIADGQFAIPPSGWNRGEAVSGLVKAAFQARAFSPGVVIAELSGEPPYNYKIITTAVPMPEAGTCTIHLTLALPKTAGAEDCDRTFVEALLQVSREGLEKDRAIWNNLCPQSVVNWTAQDKSAREFARFCERFRD